MKIIKLTLLMLSLFVIISCGDSTGSQDKKEIIKEGNSYKKCLETFFSGIPLENCQSFAVSDSEKRTIEIKEAEKRIEVYIEIPECRKDFKLYHSWIASELQTSCIESNKTVSYSFMNKDGSEIYFSLQADSIPLFEEKNNTSLYIDKTVPKQLVAQVESVLFNPQISSEKTYYIYMQNEELQVCSIHYIEWGDQQATKEATALLYKLKKQFDSSDIRFNIKFHTLEHYGRTIFSL